MELGANENKKIEIEVDGKTYERYAIKTHFVQLGEDYIEIIKKETLCDSIISERMVDEVTNLNGIEVYLDVKRV